MVIIRGSANKEAWVGGPTHEIKGIVQKNPLHHPAAGH